MKKVFVVLIIFLIGLVAGYFIFNRGNKKIIQEAEKKIRIQKDSVKALKLKIGEYKEIEDSLNDSIKEITDKYTAIKSRPITSADSLQGEEIRKGVQRFGPAPIAQEKPAMASLYGNQAFDVLEVTEKRLENQMKVSATYHGITIHQDTIINEQDMVIRVLKKETIRKNLGWFLGGSVVGFLLSLLLL